VREPRVPRGPATRRERSERRERRGGCGERATPSPGQDPASGPQSDEALGDMEAEAGLALEDFVVVVLVSEVGGAQLGPSIEVTEALEGVVRLERLLGEDQEIGLARSGIVAVHTAGLADRGRDALFEVPELVEIAVGRAGDRKNEKEFHCCESRCLGAAW